jgi:hypothetical protein
MGVTLGADAEMIGGWHFNDLDGSELKMEADHGAGLMTRDHLGGSFLLYEGTELNGIPGDRAGQAIGVRGSAANGTWLELTSATKPGLELSLDFAWRSTATGFDDNLVQHWDGLNWVTFGAFGSDDGGEWERAVFSFVGGLEETRLRILLDGGDGANGVTRLDNLHLTGIPAPGAWALCGFGGLFGLGSRVRRA